MVRLRRVSASLGSRLRLGLGLGLGLGLSLGALALVPACGGGDDGSGGACDPNTEDCTIERDLSTLTIPAGHEDEDTCQSWTLNNPTELWINGVTERNDGAYHHANWFFVPDDMFALPDGTWSCSDNNFSELNAAVIGGYLFALSTQSASEDQELPTGSAIRIPPYSRIIGSSHLLNASGDDITTTMHLQLHTIPPAEVKAKMAPARIQYHDLSLDPMAKSSFTTECLFDQAYQTQLGRPMQYELHYALSHYHGLGAYARLEIAGGPHDGQLLMEHDGFGENFGVAFEPPIDLAALGARGVRFTCGFDNPRQVPVGWGIGDQEMCVIALQAKTDLAWDGDVKAGTGTRVGPDQTGEVKYNGPCDLLAFPWDFDKPGGPPR
ncbi:MAG TPA: hypothetical protein VHE35_32680 [Kofleriaceae bacterium]|nr:hypothetical protein [Kofleriaceae bacterium]